MKIIYCEQLSDVWWEAKKGKMSASKAQAIGNNGRGLDTYITELMADYYSSGEKEHYTNKDIERGIELEEYAREIYELETGNKVEQVGFIKYNDYTLCSPDGLIEKDGGIEIKALNNINHFKMIINGEKEIESKHIWQIQMSLFITKRKWWDFVSYNPNYKKSLLIFRIKPDKIKFKKINEGLKAGECKIKEITNAVSNI